MKKYDLIVVGGGISGVAAAVSAAREGISVLLIEKTGSLGGAMSDSLVYPFMKFRMPESGKYLSDGIFTEMRERHKKFNDNSFETFKFVFDDMVTEAGVDVLFHACVFEAATQDRRIRSLKVATKAGIMIFEADFFVDASGDGELLFMTDCEFQLGREEDGLCQPMTTCFRVGDIDVNAFKQDRERIQQKYKEYQAAKKITNPRENILVFFGLGEGTIHINTTRVVRHNPVEPFELSKAEIIARRQIHEMIDFMKEVSHAFDNCTLISIANHIGVRESRKLKGVYVLTETDLANFVEFEDTIALGNYEIDIHNPSGTGTEIIKIPADKYYQIPYRSLIPKEYDNMLVAGRCLSATHRAHSAVRIMPICACLGEAAGAAISIANKTTKNIQNIDIKALRELLIKKGAAV